MFKRDRTTRLDRWWATPFPALGLAAVLTVTTMQPAAQTTPPFQAPPAIRRRVRSPIRAACRRRRAAPGRGAPPVFPAGQYPVSLPAVSLLGARNDLPNPYQPGVRLGPAARRTQVGIHGQHHHGARRHDLGRRSLRRLGRGRHDVRRAERAVDPIFQFDTVGQAAQELRRAASSSARTS